MKNLARLKYNLKEFAEDFAFYFFVVVGFLYFGVIDLLRSGWKFTKQVYWKGGKMLDKCAYTIFLTTVIAFCVGCIMVLNRRIDVQQMVHQHQRIEHTTDSLECAQPLANAHAQVLLNAKRSGDTISQPILHAYLAYDSAVSKLAESRDALERDFPIWEKQYNESLSTKKFVVGILFWIFIIGMILFVWAFSYILISPYL